MLDDGGNGLQGHALVGGQDVGNVVLVGNAHLGLTGADHGLGGILRGLDDLDVDALVLEEALVLCHVDAGVVGVGGVVQAEGDLLGVARVLLCAGSRALSARVVIGAAASQNSGGSDASASEEGTTREVLDRHGGYFLSALFQGMQMRWIASTTPIRASDNAEMSTITANILS